MPDLRHPLRPCSECPWRRDQPLGRFEASRYEELRDTSAGPAGSAPLGAPMFACHKSHEGADLACAGWLAVEGHGHVAVRLAVVQGRLDAEALAAGHDWPQLYDSYEQMAAANGASFPDPPATRRACGEICRLLRGGAVLDGKFVGSTAQGPSLMAVSAQRRG